MSRQLKERREATGLTADQVTEQARQAGASKWSASKITRLERNEWLRPTVEDVELLLDIYRVTDLAQRAEYVQLAKEARQKGWWSAYADVLGRGLLTGLEPGASRIRTVEIAVLPGLLQTESYARRIIEGGGVEDTAEVTRRVEARMLRQQLLDPKGSPPVYWAIIDEAAIRKIPADIREEQIRYLIDVQRPALRVQILPDEAGLHAAVGGGFTLLDFPEDSGLVYTENSVASRIDEEPEALEAWDLVYQYVSASAMSVEATRTHLVSLL
ncbi:helix-turn-helix domain-containing protein [Nocardiopsis mangrovi]|uniref:Helix-turn-helix domain-containing protein n=1 Tax=Nocardiopsis mangrovi TaxID=1179818 RepID=A0ABV9DST6_9ACTN